MQKRFESIVSKNKIVNELKDIVLRKQSCLCVSADLTTCQEVLDLADEVGPYICILKLHCDCLSDFDFTFVEKLLSLKKKHSFLIFEDRKFADIGAIVKKQYENGIYRIHEWADIVDCHLLPGQTVLQGLEKAKAILLIDSMSTSSLIDKNYQERTLNLAKQAKNVIGFITQRKIDNYLCFTPGISLDVQGDDLGQLYKTPEQALKDGADILIVGRGILKDPKKCILYKNKSWFYSFASPIPSARMANIASDSGRQGES